MKWGRWAIGLVMTLVAAGIYGVWDELSFRSELDEARKEMASGRLFPARKRLVALTNRPLAKDESWLARGDCEMQLGEVERAVASWSRISDSSPSAGEAAAKMARNFFGRGKLSSAEEKLTSALRKAGLHHDEALKQMILLMKFQGRLPEVRRLIQEARNSEKNLAEVVLELWDHDYSPYPIEGVRRFLGKAYRSSPDDDRVWLARANLATRLGNLDEADGWLKKCSKQRAEDPAVWLARLDWCIASDRPDEAVKALTHIPADFVVSAERLALRAWFASRKGDIQAERKALEGQIDEGLRDASPLERLAELASLQGDTTQASKYRARKLDYENWVERYKSFLSLDDPSSRANELALIAESLGRRFDSWCWWTIHARNHSDGPIADRDLGRLKDVPVEMTFGRSLAELMADVIPVSETSANSSSMSLIVPNFEEKAEKSGLIFTYDNGRSEARHLPETMGGGVALLDFDGDGRLDVFCVQGGRFPPESNPTSNQDRLFKNIGGGFFRDVTMSSGLAHLPGGYGHGVTVGDFDNDGDPDLFLTRWRSYALFRNRGDGTFEDATDVCGLGGERDWPTSSAFADLDNDGDLDLYVCHYLAWDPSNQNPCPQDNSTVRYYCYPRLFRALPDHLFRNDDGRFVDITSEAGIVDKEGRGLGVVAGDLDSDGLIDLYVANDTTANYYFHNLGGLKFEEIASTSGVAANGSGTFQAGMGVAFGDHDGNGLMDLAVTNFYAEGISLFANAGKNMFFDHSMKTGLAATSRNFLGFGVAFFDANNDGRLDIVAAHGHVNDGRPRLPYAMPARLWISDSRGRLTDSSARAGEPWQVDRLGRGLATGDLDNDGQLDVVILAENEPLAFFHNISTNAGRWITIGLQGKHSNRDAIGVRVKLVAGGLARISQRFGGGSYQSNSDFRLHFGLGQFEKVDSIEISWPSGGVDRHDNLAVNRGYLIREGEVREALLPHFPNN